MTYQDVINIYNKKAREICIGDDNLDTPRTDLPIVGEYIYGVAWMRDDAVELLIERINTLENMITRTNEILKEM